MSEKDNFYLPQLNGLRFIAFIMIFFVHAPVFFFTTNSTRLFELNKIVNDKLQVSLNFGVDLFFCLSAFLITTLLLIEYERKDTISINNFLVRRVLRLCPLYFLYLFIVYIVLPFTNSMPDVIPSLGSEGYSQTIRSWLIPSVLFYINSIGFSPMLTQHLWSISLEMQIYFTLPFVLYYFLTRQNKTHKENIRSLFKVLILLLIFTNLIKLSFILMNSPHPKIYMTTLSRLDPFIIGTLVSIKYIYFREKIVPFELPISLFILSLNFILPSPFGEPNYYTPVVYLVNAVGFGLFLDYIITRPVGLVSKTLSLKPLSFLGNLTYGLYVFHIIGLHLTNDIFAYFNLPIVDVYWLLYIFTGFSITFIFACISYYLYEKRFLNLKLRFTAIRKTESVPSRS